jgi:hypothetical protein
LASHNAGVTVVIVAISNHVTAPRRLFAIHDNGADCQRGDNINAYLVPAQCLCRQTRPLSGIAEMTFGSKPTDGGHLLMSVESARFGPQPRRACSVFASHIRISGVHSRARALLPVVRTMISKRRKPCPLQVGG